MGSWYPLRVYQDYMGSRALFVLDAFLRICVYANKKTLYELVMFVSPHVRFLQSLDQFEPYLKELFPRIRLPRDFNLTSKYPFTSVL